MKPIFAIAVLLFLSSTALYSQLKLERLPVAITEDETINTASFPTNSTGYIRKFFGKGMDTILKTTDGGRTWHALKLPENDLSLRHISCIDSNKIVLSTGSIDSNYHAIFYSWDGGETWVKKYSPPFGFGPRVDFYNDSVGYAHYGSEVYKTSDTGNSWIKIFEMGMLIQGKSFLNGQIGYVTARDRMIFRTDNGGEEWVRQNEFYDSNKFYGNYNSPIFVNKDTIFITGWDFFTNDTSHFLMYSYNGGQLWFSKFREETFLDVKLINHNIGYAVGYSEKREAGIVAKTKDCGKTWEIFDSNVDHVFRSLFIMDDSTAIIHADSGMYRLHLHFLTKSIAEKEPVEKLQLVSYPNPASDVITLETFLSATTNIQLELVDINGRVIEKLDKGRKPQGKYTFHYNTQKLTVGSYIFRLQTGEQVATQKFIKSK